MAKDEQVEGDIAFADNESDLGSLSSEDEQELEDGEGAEEIGRDDDAVDGLQGWWRVAHRKAKRRRTPSDVVDSWRQDRPDHFENYDPLSRPPHSLLLRQRLA